MPKRRSPANGVIPPVRFRRSPFLNPASLSQRLEPMGPEETTRQGQLPAGLLTRIQYHRAAALLTLRRRRGRGVSRRTSQGASIDEGHQPENRRERDQEA